jgi:hypothetical protein
VHEPPPPLVPATVAPAAAPAPAGDRWRIVAAAGLLAAIAFLVVLALHG